jgi:hypothetical protein
MNCGFPLLTTSPPIIFVTASSGSSKGKGKGKSGGSSGSTERSSDSSNGKGKGKHGAAASSSNSAISGGMILVGGLHVAEHVKVSGRSGKMIALGSLFGAMVVAVGLISFRKSMATQRDFLEIEEDDELETEATPLIHL